MSRFALFGVLPVTFTPDGTWRADTGSRLTDAVANAVARAALIVVAAAEHVLNIQIPVRIVPIEEQRIGRISA